MEELLTAKISKLDALDRLKVNSYIDALLSDEKYLSKRKFILIKQTEKKMIKVKVSCTTQEELVGMIRLLSPIFKKVKQPKEQTGDYMRAYFIDLDIGEDGDGDAGIQG